MLPTQSSTRPVADPLVFAIEDCLSSTINEDNLPGGGFFEFPNTPISLIADYVGDVSFVSQEDLDRLGQIIATVSDRSIPKELVKIIAEYYCSDHAVALQDFTTDDDGHMSTSKRTSEAIRNARYEALISHECNPVIKRMIFHKSSHGNERRVLQDIINEIKRKGYQLILDGVDLRGLDLSGFDFSGMSAVNAILSGTLMRNTILKNVDFTDAYIQGSWIINSNMAQSILVRTKIDDSFFNHVDLSGANGCDVVAVKPASFYKVNAFGLITNNMYLKTFIEQIKNKNNFDALLRRVELIGVFSTESGCDEEATTQLIEEVAGLDKSNAFFASSSCAIS